MLRVWGSEALSNVQKILSCCAEFGLPFERKEIGSSDATLSVEFSSGQRLDEGSQWHRPQSATRRKSW
jgi:hypothetical protein